jgi:hypothetical protein
MLVSFIFADGHSDIDLWDHYLEIPRRYTESHREAPSFPPCLKIKYRSIGPILPTVLKMSASIWRAPVTL